MAFPGHEIAPSGRDVATPGLQLWPWGPLAPAALMIGCSGARVAGADWWKQVSPPGGWQWPPSFKNPSSEGG
eukprot:382990-Pyramimonas_sp.AAC.1